MFQGKQRTTQATVDETVDDAKRLSSAVGDAITTVPQGSRDAQAKTEAADSQLSLELSLAKPERLAAVTAAAKRKRKSTYVSGQVSTDPVLLDTQQAYQILQQVWAQDHELLDLLYQAQGVYGTGSQVGTARAKKAVQAEALENGANAAGTEVEAADMFFVRSVLVTPNKFRPFSVMAEIKYEHSQNVILVKVLKACLDIFDLHGAVQVLRASGGSVPDIVERYVALCRALQNHVCSPH
jgi:hypothetical protein